MTMWCTVGSSHTPREPGHPHKFPLGVVDTWTDDHGVSQHIPIHPDTGCAAAGVDSCFKCTLDDCLGHETATLKKRKAASLAAGGTAGGGPRA